MADCISLSTAFATGSATIGDVSNRQQRRQGVTYGPARPSGSGGAGNILGRILGFFVLVMAVVVLGFGVVNFFGNQDPSPSRTPTLVALATPTIDRSQLPTAQPTGTALPTEEPSPSGSSEPGHSASPSPPLIQVGPGFVTFGTRADDELRILDPKTSFTSDERIVWSAYLVDPVNAAEVRVLVVKEDPESPGGERLIADDEISPAGSDAQLFLRRIRPPRYLDGPGHYTVRYVRGDRLMAEGYFVLTD